jgi:hypothetical protein
MVILLGFLMRERCKWVIVIDKRKLWWLNSDYLGWFSTRWVKRNMCALCRNLHNPIVFRNLLWWWNMPSLSIISESTRVYVRKATDGWIFLMSYLDFPVCIRVPMIVSMILQSLRWRIFCVGIPHTTWRIHVLGSLSHQSIWVAIRSSDELLLSLTPATSFKRVPPF